MCHGIKSKKTHKDSNKTHYSGLFKPIEMSENSKSVQNKIPKAQNNSSKPKYIPMNVI